MSDYVLFALSPYIAAAACLLILTARCLRSRRNADRLSGQLSDVKQIFWRPLLWRVGLLLVVAGHLIMIFLLRWLLPWIDISPRPNALVWIALAPGLLVLTGLVQLIWRHGKRMTAAEASLMALLVVLTVSGLLTGILYRWSTSWSQVTLAPYVQSVLSLNPAIDLVANLPFLVRLHVFSAIALIAVLPLTRLAAVALIPLNRLLTAVLATLARQSNRLREAASVLARRTAQTVSNWMEEEYE